MPLITSPSLVTLKDAWPHARVASLEPNVRGQDPRKLSGRSELDRSQQQNLRADVEMLTAPFVARDERVPGGTCRH
jgi:hypothetical protein